MQRYTMINYPMEIKAVVDNILYGTILVLVRNTDVVYRKVKLPVVAVSGLDIHF